MKALVAYASRHGSTREIALRIADAIRRGGIEVDVRSVDECAGFDACDGVVFGGGIYDGSWMPEATDLVRRHATVLAQKPVWLFSAASFGDRHPIIGGLMKKEPKPESGTVPKSTASRPNRGLSPNRPRRAPIGDCPQFPDQGS